MNIESLAQELVDKRNNIIPIIGNEMVVFIDSNGKEIPFQQHLIDTFAVDQKKLASKSYMQCEPKAIIVYRYCQIMTKGFLTTIVVM